MSYIIAALVIAAAAFGAAWKTQDWRYGAKEKERVEAQIETNRIQHLADSKRQDTVIKAQSAAVARTNAARRDAAAATAERDGLQLVIDAASSTSNDLATCNKHTAALGVVFSACTKEVQGMADVADGHAGDVKLLQDAWPK